MSIDHWVDPRDAYLAIAVGEDQVAWAVATCVTHSRDVEDVRSGVAPTREDAVEEALFPILSTKEVPVNLYTSVGEWEEVAPGVSTCPHVETYPSAHGHTHRLRTHAYEAAVNALAQAKVNPASTTVVAVDGSYSRSQNTIGWAWLSENGEFSRGSGEGSSATLAEVSAIVAALNAHKGNVHLLVDCYEAIEVCRNAAHTGNGHVSELARQAHKLMRGREVTFEWVKAHDGHALNEGANRLAVAARRCREAVVNREVANQVAERIASECAGAHKAGVRVHKTRPVKQPA